MNNLYRELTATEKQSIRRLVISECANYDREYGCLPLDGTCYMSTIAFAGSSLCKWFQGAVLPLDRHWKPCSTANRSKPASGSFL